MKVYQKPDLIKMAVNPKEAFSEGYVPCTLVEGFTRPEGTGCNTDYYSYRNDYPTQLWQCSDILDAYT